MEDRILNPSEINEDTESDNPLRPQTLIEYVGQEKLKENLKVFIDAAKFRKEPLDHVLLYGPPGLGKTTLSMIIAKELGVNIRITSGPAIEKPGIWRHFLRIYPKATFYSSMRYTDSTRALKKFFILRWKITVWIS